ncbi:BspA family leucine-rich repeat surface protein [Leuconostoc pseudomesenteroides]|uniref:BspA family leucine-rich repeat surface protein n=1 Tax=Leuconostoc pseudomesenteroides TaxID=33968 RepID=UPI00403D828B
MRFNKQLYLPILITLLTVTGPVQAVTAAEVMTADDVKTDTKLRLPNDGRSDLQELIQRVATGDTGDGQPTEPEPDEPETPEVAEPEQPEETDPPVEQPTVAKADSKPASSAKAPRAITTNTNGTSTWTFDSDTGLLVFGAGQLSQRIDQNLEAAGLVATQVKKIQFESNVIAPVSVTYLFANLGQLSEFIDLQNFDTSNVTSMSYWFYNSKGLTNPDLSALNTSNVTNMSSMFYGSGVTNLDLRGWNVDKVTSFSYMFYNDTALSTLNLSNWGGNRIATSVDMSYMFYGTSALTNLNLTNFKTTNVTTMSCMFYNTALTSLDLSNWDVSQATTFSRMFYNATKLASLNLTNWGVGRTATSVSMTDMFCNTSALINLNLTNFKTTNVTTMSLMFYGTALTSLDLSDWDVTKVTNFSFMFYQTTKLTSLNLTNWGLNRTATSVSMSYMFYGTSALTNLNLTNFKTTDVTNMSYMFYQASALTSLDLSDWDVTKVTNFSYMFYQATKLTSLNLTNWGVSRIAASVNMANMFNGTSALTNLNLTNFKTTNVTNMANMFQSTGLTELDLSDWDVTKVVNFNYMFDTALKLKNLNLSNWRSSDSSTSTVMTHMFRQTGALESLTLTNFTTTNVTEMSYMFASSSSLKVLDLHTWDVSKVIAFPYMFNNMLQLTTLNLSGWRHNDSSTSTYMTSMFQYTPALKSLILTDFTTTNVTNMPNMFHSTGLESLDLHTWDVSKVGSFQSMFDYSSLKEVNLSGWRQQDSPVETNFNVMFAHTLSLKSVIFTDFNTENVQSVSSMFSGSSIETLDLSSWDFRNLGSVMDMLRDTKKLWRITLGENCQFLGTPTFTTAPQVGTTITDNDQTYKTTTASWQEVGAGTAHNPKGAFVTTDEMWSDTATRPVTYVWAQAPTFDGVANLTFGTLGAGNFRNGNKPLATNTATGSVNLINLESGVPYKVSVAQTSDWTTSGQSATISKHDLSIQYGDNSLTNSVDFWSGNSTTSQKSIFLITMPLTHLAFG